MQKPDKVGAVFVGVGEEDAWLRRRLHLPMEHYEGARGENQG
jgi:hypothetical protein